MDVKLLSAGLNQTPQGQFLCGAVLARDLADSAREYRDIQVDAGGVRRSAGRCYLEMRGGECWAVGVEFNSFGRRYAGASGGFFLAPTIAYDAETREVKAIPYLTIAGRLV